MSHTFQKTLIRPLCGIASRAVVLHHHHTQAFAAVIVEGSYVHEYVGATPNMPRYSATL